VKSKLWDMKIGREWLTLPTRCLVRVSNFHPSPRGPSVDGSPALPLLGILHLWTRQSPLTEVVSSAKRVPRIWKT
jgi:hypothetical protein